MQILKETCGNNLVIGELLPYMYSCYAVQCVISFSALLVGNIVGRGSFLLKKFMACLLDKVRSAVCCLRICLQLVPSHSLSAFFLALSLYRSLSICRSRTHLTFAIFVGRLKIAKSRSATAATDAARARLGNLIFYLNAMATSKSNK